MRYLRWTFWISVWALFAAFLHYTLPQYDVVRLTDTYNQRIDFGENSVFWSDASTGNTTGMTNRDVFFVSAVNGNGRQRVYRNEDTGWGWPPYFKFNTANLQAEAADARSTAAAPEWYAVKHYGWRNEFLSIYPNIISLRSVEGPDVTMIPRTTIALLLVIAAFLWFITVRWRRFKARRITPVLDDLDDRFDDRRAGFSEWINSWRKKPR